MADLIERIESTRFLGAEFLVWLWFKAELFEGNFQRADGTPLELWLDSKLLLRDAADTSERIQFSGANPSATPEAKLALRSNKLPKTVRVRLRLREREYSFAFDADTFSFGSVKLPELLTEESDDRFLERMELLETLDDVWRELYAEFLQVRLSPSWKDEIVTSVIAWAKGKPTLNTEQYRALLKTARKAVPLRG